jgi:hypothetical protein
MNSVTRAKCGVVQAPIKRMMFGCRSSLSEVSYAHGRSGNMFHECIPEHLDLFQELLLELLLHDLALVDL